MRRGLSNAPLIRSLIRLSDRRYARQRALEALDRRVAFLEATTRRESMVIEVTERVAELLHPRSAGNQKRFIGNAHDGGYLVVEQDWANTAVVSVGVGRECSADDALADLGCVVFQFDHTVDSSPSRCAGVRFHKTGLGTSSGGHHLIGLDEMLSAASATDRKEFMLMLDAEGAEWDGLLDCSEETLLAMSQVSVEYHGLELACSEGLNGHRMNVLERMNRYFHPIYAHGNNFEPAFSVRGQLIPSVCEVLYLRRDLWRPGSASEVVSIPPNDPTWPDLPQSRLFSHPE